MTSSSGLQSEGRRADMERRWRALEVDLEQLLEWTLRVGAFLCFVGHGAFGIMTKEAWVPYFAVAGIGPERAFQLMPAVGAVDILVGTLTLVRPRVLWLAYMVVWALWTAALRPLAGEPSWEALERAGNYGVPFALLLLSQASRDWRSWFAPAVMRPLTASVTPSLTKRLRVTLAVTTALLLIGHGALAVTQKPLLISHNALLSLSVDPAALTSILGWMEIGFGVLVLWRQSIGFCLFLLGWKLATESLFLVAGAPIWEFVERGGSYAAPLALALLLAHERAEGRRDAAVSSTSRAPLSPVARA